MVLQSKEVITMREKLLLTEAIDLYTRAEIKHYTLGDVTLPECCDVKEHYKVIEEYEICDMKKCEDMLEEYSCCKRRLSELIEVTEYAILYATYDEYGDIYEVEIYDTAKDIGYIN